MSDGGGATAGDRGAATALLVAAGSGERLGADRPKALLPVAGRPMYEWSLAAFAASGRLERVVIAAPPGHRDEVAAAVAGPERGSAAAAGDGVAVEVVEGGATRAESVRAALVPAETEVVLVHDAARPLVTPDLIVALLDALAAAGPDIGGAIAAAPITDTVKRCEPAATGGPRIVETLDRSRLWAAQTPQAFEAATLRRAFEAASDRAAATDDAALVESLGLAVAVHPAPPGNFKVTTADDLRLAELLLTAGR